MILELLPVATVLLLPGFTLVVATNNHRGRGLADILGLSFGLSLVLLPILLMLNYAMVRTVNSAFLYLIIFESVSILLFRIKSLREIKIGREDVIIMLLILSLTAGIISIFYYLSPIFPFAYSADFEHHLAMSKDFLRGSTELSSVSYPPAVHFLIGSGISLMGLESIISMRQTMILLGVLAPLLIYSTASNVLHNRKVAVLASLLYIPVGMWWHVLFINSLYANFYANLVSLSVLLLLVEYVELGSKLRMGLLFLGGLALYLSHFTILIFLVALWVMVPVAFFLARPMSRPLLKGIITLTIPSVVIAILRPNLVSLILSIPGSSGGDKFVGIPTTTLTSFLGSFSYFLQFLYFNLQSESLFFLALVLIFTTPLLVLRQRLGIWAFFFCVWFFVVWATAPMTKLAWRSSYYALLPLVFVFAISLRSIDIEAGQIKKTYYKAKANSSHLFRRLIQFALLGIIFTSSLLPPLLSDAFENPEDSRSQDEGIYDAVKWVRSNTLPNQSVLVVVGDWRLTYVGLLTGRPVSYYSFLSPNKTVDLAMERDSRFIIVSRVVVQNGSALSLYEIYKKADGFTVVWENSSVVIFAIPRRT